MLNGKFHSQIKSTQISKKFWAIPYCKNLDEWMKEAKKNDTIKWLGAIVKINNSIN